MSNIIAIDGPAGSGKGTIADILSKKLNYINIDTGATYRCVALKAIRNNLLVDDTDKIIEIAKNIKIDEKLDGTILMDGEDVTNLIREKDVTNIVSQISSIVEVRKYLVDIQRKMASNNDVIMEGRDITTVVFPDAKYKFYLDASLDERVRRRIKQNEEKNIDMSYEEVYNNISMRDLNDINKEVGALKRTDEQIYIDSTNLTIDEVVSIMLQYIKGDEVNES